MKKILFITGTRADYGKLKPLAKAAQGIGHHVSFWITGMHVSEEFGLTKLEVIRDGYDATDEYINQKQDDIQSVIIAKTITAFTDYLLEKRPHLVIIHGDRLEALACTIAAATNYIKVLHVEGGEVSGTIDEVFRHAVSKFANIHCVSSIQAKQRLIAMGERPNTVHVLGSPELDLHLNCDSTSLADVKKHYDIAYDEYGIVIFHPVTSELSTILSQAELLFSELIKTRKRFVIIRPNNDPGANLINNVIKKLPKQNFKIIASMRFEYFSVLLQNSAAIIGNSSAGVREAPFLGIPSLNVGTRQIGRSSSESITHVSANETSLIRRFFNYNWGAKYLCDNSFGFGDSVERFKILLDDPKIFEKVEQKLFFDGD